MVPKKNNESVQVSGELDRETLRYIDDCTVFPPNVLTFAGKLGYFARLGVDYHKKLMGGDNADTGAVEKKE